MIAYHGGTKSLTMDRIKERASKEKRSKDGYPGEWTLGSWWTSSFFVAQTYGNNIFKAEIEFDNPMIVDFKGADWDRFREGKYVVTSDDFAIEAFEKGHDGLILKNIVDPGMYGTYSKGDFCADDIVLFDPDQIKSYEKIEQLFERILKRSFQKVRHHIL